MEKTQRLENISIEKINPNPDNPRIIFRQEELDNLLISIKKFGIQVPISVYKDKNEYILIDGERRWRTCKKLNFKEIPALINPKPSQLDNLLMMFNIHSLREQWDYFTIANKLITVTDLLKRRNGDLPNEIELSAETGLTRGTIRRCKMLIELPERFKKVIFEELQKSKNKQKFTEDFFLEMEGALKTVKKNCPDVIDNIDNVRDVLMEKFQNGTIGSMVDFRMISKIATAPKNVGLDNNSAQKALGEIFTTNDKSIEQVFSRTVANLYDEKKTVTNFGHLLSYIRELTLEEKNDKEIIALLKEIKRAIEEIGI